MGHAISKDLQALIYPVSRSQTQASLSALSHVLCGQDPKDKTSKTGLACTSLSLESSPKTKYGTDLKRRESFFLTQVFFFFQPEPMRVKFKA